MVFFGCKKRDRQQKKKEAKKRTDKKELTYKIVKNEYVHEKRHQNAEK